MKAKVTDTPSSLSHLHPKLNVPVRAILAQAVFNLLFGLIYLGNTRLPTPNTIISNIPSGPEVAFNAYIASCTLFLNLSYAAPIMILLIRGRDLVLDNPPEFCLGKVWGYVMNYTAVIFVIVTSVVSPIIPLLLKVS